jgi:hypothetical protein
MRIYMSTIMHNTEQTPEIALLDKAATQLFIIAFYRNEKDNQPRPEQVTFEQIVQLLSNASQGEKSGPAWAPHTLKPDATRANANVLGVWPLVFDIDHVSDTEVVEVYKNVGLSKLDALRTLLTATNREIDPSVSW